MNQFSLKKIDNDRIVDVWPVLAIMLAPYLEKNDGRVRLEDAFAKLVSGEWQLWAAWNRDEERPGGFISARVVQEPSGTKTCDIKFLVGESRRQWLCCLPILENWAVNEGCTHIQMLTPKAFAKDLSEYHMSHVFLERAL
jgi:hypothetical protein